jgi:uncharacterized damage-inducible protein DinB
LESVGFEMPQTKLLADLESYTVFLDNHRETDSEVWFSPIAEGKWSIHDIVSHIMMWDRHFLSESMRSIEAGEMVPLQEEGDYQTFNDRAVALGHRMGKTQLIDEAIRFRSELVARLRRLEAAAFTAPPASGRGMTLKAFLQQMFVDHDRHHVGQIQSYLSQR